MDTAKTEFDKSQSPILQQRYTNMQVWLSLATPTIWEHIEPLANDASFRRYFRVFCKENTYVAMDAPPNKENCLPFVEIAEIFKRNHVDVPTILAKDFKQGFLLLSDFGDRLYLKELTSSTVNHLYNAAFKELLKIQKCRFNSYYCLPHFDEKLLHAECQLFIDWYLLKNKNIVLSTQDLELLNTLFNKLIDVATKQPQVCVHRDYHSRNLILHDSTKVGILDFQDAVFGPITYDLVSLLRDCYVTWPEEKISKWIHEYYDLLIEERLLDSTSFENFTLWFDLAGLQRHLKCLGIFSRLNFRDQKPAYLNNIPRIVNYVKFVCQRYPEYRALLNYIE